MRVVFSQTRNLMVIAFTDANMYATSMEQRSCQMRPFRIEGSDSLPTPACVIVAVRLSKALKDAHSKGSSNLHVRAARF